MICPKCHYQRKTTDYNPDWECPNCRIAYDKVASCATNNALNNSDVRRQQRKAKNNKRGLLWLLVFLTFSLILIVVTHQQDQQERFRETDIRDDAVGKPVAAEDKSAVPRAYSECKSGLCVEAVRIENIIEITFINDHNSAITAYFKFDGDNISYRPQSEFSRSNPANGTIGLVNGHIIEREKPHEWNYTYTFRFGDKDAKHNDDMIYQLPYLIGTSHKVAQSHSGNFSHNKIYSACAIDFIMPVGTSVCAARDGFVVAVKKVVFVGQGSVPAVFMLANKSFQSSWHGVRPYVW